uniref:Vespid chemotactic peptide 5e n=3 Tax=Vespinae TaxID=7439 RepID=CRBLE_VESMG|nr:RecName: Full=Vespid chemotactic peptide 5e; Short=VCP 5e [Vespa magnifica]P17234.1 RecName: Full=Vespid chemotactic peptide X; Short=VESCP-X; Short=Ves-CP-X [Vespa simillima xanthoptera]
FLPIIAKLLGGLL